jgi:hypothetical protein
MSFAILDTNMTIARWSKVARNIRRVTVHYMKTDPAGMADGQSHQDQQCEV